MKWNRFHHRKRAFRMSLANARVSNGAIQERVSRSVREVDMTSTCVQRSGLFVALLCATVCISSPAFAQRADRATISGVVTDNQAAAVPGATVTIKNEDTGVENVLVTNSAGVYTSPPLVLGRYCAVGKKRGPELLQRAGGDREGPPPPVGNLPRGR